MNKHDATIYLKGIKDFYGLDKDSEEAIDVAIEALSAERTGEWIEHKYAEEYDGLMQSNFECSKCHDWLREQTNHCPTCGARMKGQRNE